MTWGVIALGGPNSASETESLAGSSRMVIEVEAGKKDSPKETVPAKTYLKERPVEPTSFSEDPKVLDPPKPVVVAVEEPKQKPEPKPPKPAVVEPTKPVGEIWWRMDEGADAESLVDTTGKISIPTLGKGEVMPPVAPDEIPLNRVRNPSAFKVGIWEEKKPSNLFELTPAFSFTFECWFLCERIRKPVFLVGTRSGEAEGGRGWHLDLRPPTGGRREGQMSFFYDSGEKMTQALASAVNVADLKPHHAAVVWDHNASKDAGEMRLFLDGEQVAAKLLLHKMLFAKQANSFRIGAEGNPDRLALDELRFTRRALAPHEFLLRQSVVGVTFKASNSKSRDSWSQPSNWERGAVPGKGDNVVIGSGLVAQVEKVAPARYEGALVLKEKSQVVLWDNFGLDALPKSPAVLVMNQGSQLILRSNKNAVIGPVEFLDRAVIWGGASTSGHRTVRLFKGTISGPGKFTLEGVNGNTFEIDGSNTFTGGFEARSSQKQSFVVSAKSDGAFWSGEVKISDHGSLVLEKGLKDAISDRVKLSLEGGTAPNMMKLVIDSEEQVAEFFVDGEDQGVGVFTSRTHPSLGGSGKLIVEPVD